jgi:hypothetical protein
METHILTDAEVLDILENDKWISSEEEFDVESEYNYSSDSDDGENEGNDLQNIVMSDYVGSGGNEVGEDLSEMYSSTNFDWSTDSQNVNHFEYIASPGLNPFSTTLSSDKKKNICFQISYMLCLTKKFFLFQNFLITKS